jgi:glycosyltransferase involved in cell wall biosynthesis
VNRPLVSVIVPAYAAERFIGEAIESVLAQTYAPLELIVVDDGSADRTAEVAAGYPRATLLRQPNAGPAAARNRGLEAARGELISFLDADDMMVPDKLDVQVRHLAENPAVDVVIGAQELLVEPGAERPFWVEGSEAADVVPTRPADIPGEPNTYAMSMLVRREVFDEVGEFDGAVEPAEDIDWALRAVEEEVEIAWLPRVMIRRRVHPDSLTQDAAAARAGLFKAFKARIERHRARAASA